MCLHVHVCVWGAAKMPVVVWHQQTVEANFWRRRGETRKARGNREEGRKYVCVCHVGETRIVPSNFRLQVF